MEKCLEKLKVLTVFGTRPESIKMAPLVKELEKEELIDSYVCVTAQHREMLDQVLEIFKIKPDFDLDIMQSNQSLIDITNRGLSGLFNVMRELKPDIVLVHGDTTTTFVGSLAAFYNKIKVGHVEAGLRTFDRYFPYPEEINRKLTGVLADYHFAPTKTNYDNLLNENVNEDSIFVTGNTVIDALKTTVNKAHVFKSKELQNILFEDKRVITITAHRRENLGEPLLNICRAVKDIALKYDDVEIVYPVHLNPAVKDCVHEILGDLKNVNLIEPLDVSCMHNLMNKSYLILTDSGGLQEEAPSLGKPVLVLRNETERPEAVKAGTVKVVGTERNNIFEMTSKLLDDSIEYDKMAMAVNPYGDGKASKRIVDILLNEFKIKNTTVEAFKESVKEEKTYKIMI